MMSRLMVFSPTLAALAFVIVAAGCGNSEDTSSEPAAMPAAGAHGDDADHDHADHQGQQGDQQHAGHDQHVPPAELAKYAEVLAELPMEDRMAVYKQKTCPVSGGVLGAMGKPYKVNVKGRDVFLCCQGCEADLTGDPEKYLAKLSD